MSDYLLSIPVVLVHEGGWVSDPVDPGGETNYGWSMMNIRHLGLTKEELGIPNWNPGCLKFMTVDTAKMLYKKYYWDKYGYSGLTGQNPATKIFDCGVNCGPVRAHEMAQEAANDCGQSLSTDGILGPKSIAGINAVDAAKFMPAMKHRMELYYTNLVQQKPQLAKFLPNWLHRAAWGV